MSCRPFHPPLMTAALLLCCCACSDAYSPEAHRVNPDAALSTLKSVLNGWIAGESPDSFQQKTPSIVVQDMQWKAGARLDAFEILSTEAVDANLRCRVKLSLNVPEQGEVEETAMYLVGTSPVLTVFRSPEL